MKLLAYFIFFCKQRRSQFHFALRDRSSFIIERSKAIRMLQKLICEAGYLDYKLHSISLSTARYLHTSRITRATLTPETANGPTLLDTGWNIERLLHHRPDREGSYTNVCNYEFYGSLYCSSPSGAGWISIVGNIKMICASRKIFIFTFYIISCSDYQYFHHYNYNYNKETRNTIFRLRRRNFVVL